MTQTERFRLELLGVIIRRHNGVPLRAGLTLTAAERDAARVTVTELLVAPAVRAVHFAMVAAVGAVAPDAGRLLNPARSWGAAVQGPMALADFELIHLLTSPAAVAETGRLAEDLLSNWYIEVLEGPAVPGVDMRAVARVAAKCEFHSPRVLKESFRQHVAGVS